MWFTLSDGLYGVSSKRTGGAAGAAAESARDCCVRATGVALAQQVWREEVVFAREPAGGRRRFRARAVPSCPRPRVGGVRWCDRMPPSVNQTLHPELSNPSQRGWAQVGASTERQNGGKPDEDASTQPKMTRDLTKKPLPNPKMARKPTRKLWSSLDTALRAKRNATFRP